MREILEATELRLCPHRRHRSLSKVLTPFGKATLLLVVLYAMAWFF
jgi:hypothetical protein